MIDMIKVFGVPGSAVRILHKDGISWTKNGDDAWMGSHQEAFEKAKACAVQAPSIRFLDNFYTNTAVVTRDW